MLTRSGDHLPSLWIKRVLVVGLLLMLPLSVVRIAQLTLRPKGSWDLFQIWWAGSQILAGRNPHVELVKLVDAGQLETTTEALAQTIEPPLPPNALIYSPYTPVVLLYASPLSALSWETAKAVWFVHNLTLAALIPIFLLVSPAFKSDGFTRLDKALFCLFFYNLLVVKLAIESAQVVTLVFGAMAASLALAPKSKLGAGVLLGLAASKYTLAASVVIFFLLRREFRVLVYAILTQLAGFAVVALISRSMPWDAIGEYYRLMRHLFVELPSERWGHTIHLAEFFPIGSWLAPLASGAAMLLVICFVGWYLLQEKRADESRPVSDLHLLAVLSLSSLLVVYHGVYDAVLYILFFGLALAGWRSPSLWKLSCSQQWFLAVLAAILAFFVTSLFTRAFYFFFPSAPDITPRFTTFILLIMLGLSIWLSYRYVKPPLAPESSPRPSRPS